MRNHLNVLVRWRRRLSEHPQTSESLRKYTISSQHYILASISLNLSTVTQCDKVVGVISRRPGRCRYSALSPKEFWILTKHLITGFYKLKRSFGCRQSRQSKEGFMWLRYNQRLMSSHWSNSHNMPLGATVLQYYYRSSLIWSCCSIISAFCCETWDGALNSGSIKVFSNMQML